MREYSKQIRKQLKETLGKAYAIQMDSLLLKLSKQFDSWKANKISCWDLTDSIHNFHQGPSRKLFDFYNTKGVDPAYLIATLIVRNVIELDDVPHEARSTVEQCVELIDSFQSDEDDDE